MRINENNFLVDFKNKVIYILDSQLKRRLFRYTFTNSKEIIIFLKKRRRLVLDSDEVVEEEEMPAGFLSIFEYTNLHSISRQAAYYRIHRGQLEKRKKGKYTYVRPREENEK